jgi:Mn-dependent DtxR family transcriptional regulator
MANTSSSAITERLDSLVKGLPDDKVRMRLLGLLAQSGGYARVADLAKRISADTSGEAARTIIAAAKDGLVQFTDGNSGVRITELGTKLANRQSKSADW